MRKMVFGFMAMFALSGSALADNSAALPRKSPGGQQPKTDNSGQTGNSNAGAPMLPRKSPNK